VSLLKRESVHLRSLAKAEHIEFDSNYAPAKEDASAVLPELEIFVPLKGLIDVQKERARLGKERERVFQEIERVEKKLANGAFIQKAPAHVLEKERAKNEELRKVLEKLDASLAKLPAG
jgi:valyl-tRNA synthetase